MDTLRILTLRHYLMLPNSTITLITGVIDQYMNDELNRGDIAYFPHLLFPIESEQLTTFRDVNKWLHDYGTVIYKYSKTSICTKIYRKLKKLYGNSKR